MDHDRKETPTQFRNANPEQIYDLSDDDNNEGGSLIESYMNPPMIFSFK